VFCRSLIVLLSFFFWPLCCLSLFNLRIMIAPLVSSDSSYCGFHKRSFDYKSLTISIGLWGKIAGKSIFNWWSTTYSFICTRQTLKKGCSRNTNRKTMKCTSHEGFTCNPSGQFNNFIPIWHPKYPPDDKAIFWGERNCKHQYFWLDRTHEATLFMCVLFKPKRKCFVDRCLSFCSMFVSFGHCVVLPSSIYEFWLPLLHLQTLLWLGLFLSRSFVKSG